MAEDTETGNQRILEELSNRRKYFDMPENTEAERQIILEEKGNWRKYFISRGIHPEVYLARISHERKKKMFEVMGNLDNMSQEEIYQFINSYQSPGDEIITSGAVSRLNKSYLAKVYGAHQNDPLGKMAKHCFEHIVAMENEKRGLIGNIMRYFSPAHLEDRL